MSLRNAAVLLFSASAIACKQGWTPLEYVGVGGVPASSCLVYNTAVLTWQGARDSCAALGGDLAVLENAVVAEAVGRMVVPQRGAPWVGAYYNGARWVWVDSSLTLPQNGSLVGGLYTPWRVLRPASPPGAARCSQLSPVSQPKYTLMHERECSAVSFSVCQGPPLHPTRLSFEKQPPHSVFTRAETEFMLQILDTEGKQALGGVARSTVVFSVVGSTVNGIREVYQSPQATFAVASKTVVLRCIFPGNYTIRFTPSFQGGFLSTPLYLEHTLQCRNNPEVVQYPIEARSSTKAYALCVNVPATLAAEAARDAFWVPSNSSPPDVTVYDRCALEDTNHYWDTPPSAVLGPPSHYDDNDQVWLGDAINCVPFNDSTTFSAEVSGETRLSLEYPSPVLFRSFSVYAPFGENFVVRATVVTSTEEGRVQEVLRRQQVQQAIASSVQQLGALALPSTVLPGSQALVQSCWELCKQLLTCAGLHTQESTLRCRLFSQVSESTPMDGYIAVRQTAAPDGSTAYDLATSVRLSGVVVHSASAAGSMSLPEGTLFSEEGDFILTRGNVSAVVTPAPVPPHVKYVEREVYYPVTAPPTNSTGVSNSSDDVGIPRYFSNFTVTMTTPNTTGVCAHLGAVSLVAEAGCVQIARLGAADWDRCLTYAMGLGAEFMSVDDQGQCTALSGACYNRPFSGSTQSARLQCSTVCSRLESTVLLTESPDCEQLQTWEREYEDECAELATSAGADWYVHRTLVLGERPVCAALRGDCSVRRIEVGSSVGELICREAASGAAVESEEEIWVGSGPTGSCPSILTVKVENIVRNKLGRKLNLYLSYAGPADAYKAARPTLPQIDTVLLTGEAVTPAWSTTPPQGEAVFRMGLTLQVHGKDLDKHTDRYELIREPAGGLSWDEQKARCAALSAPQRLFGLESKQVVLAIRNDIGEDTRAAWYTVCFALRGLLPFVPLRPQGYCGPGELTDNCPFSADKPTSLQIVPPPVRLQWMNNDPPPPTVDVGVPVNVAVQQVDARNAISSYSAQSHANYTAAFEGAAESEFDQSLFKIDQQSRFSDGYATATVTFIRPGSIRLRATGRWNFHELVVAGRHAQAVIRVIVGDPYSFNITSFPETPTTIARNVLVVDVLDKYENTVDKDFQSTCRVSANPPEMVSFDGGLATADRGVFRMKIVFAAAGTVTLAVLPQFYTGLRPVPQLLTLERNVTLYGGNSITVPTVRLDFGTSGSPALNPSQELELRRAVASILELSLSDVLLVPPLEPTPSTQFVTLTLDVPVELETEDLRISAARSLGAALFDPALGLYPFAFTFVTATVGERVVATKPPKVLLIPPRQLPDKNPFKVSANRKLTLRANVTHPAGGAWYIRWSSPDIDIDALGPDDLLTPRDSENLVIAGNLLQEGRVYYFKTTADDAETSRRDPCTPEGIDVEILIDRSCFRTRTPRVVSSWGECLAAASTSGADYAVLTPAGTCEFLRGTCSSRARTPGARFTSLCGKELLTSSAGFSIVVNAPPSRGKLFAFPRRGEALQQNFSIGGCSSGWTDDAEDLPLTYKFSYSRKGSAKEGDAREACGPLVYGEVGGPLCRRLRTVAAADAESCEMQGISGGADFYTHDSRKVSANCYLFTGECVEVAPSRTPTESLEVSDTQTPPSVTVTEAMPRTPTETPPRPDPRTLTPTTTPSDTMWASVAQDTTPTATGPAGGGEVDTGPLTSGRICFRGVAIRSTLDCRAWTNMGAPGSYFMRLCVSDVWGSPTCAEPLSVEVTLVQPDPELLARTLTNLNNTDTQGTLAGSHAVIDYINSAGGNSSTNRTELKSQVMASLVASAPGVGLLTETMHAASAVTSRPSDLDDSLSEQAVNFITSNLQAAAEGTTVEPGAGTAALEGLGSVLAGEAQRAAVTALATANESSNGTLPARYRSVKARLAHVLQATESLVADGVCLSCQRASEIDGQVTAAIDSLRVGLLNEHVSGERGIAVSAHGISMQVERTVGAPVGTVSSAQSSVQLPESLSLDVGVTGQTLDSQVTEVAEDTKAMATADVVLSPVVGFSLSSSGGTDQLPVQNLSNPLVIRMIVTPLAAGQQDPALVGDNSSDAVRSVACRWWDRAAGQWSSEGCVQVHSGSSYRCGVRYDGEPVWCRRTVGGGHAEDREGLGLTTMTPTLTMRIPGILQRRRASYQRRTGRVQQAEVAQEDTVEMTEVLCECNHATEFAFGTIDDLKPKPKLPTLRLSDLSQVSPLVWGIVGGVTGAMIVSVIGLWIIDVTATRQGRKKREDAYRKRALLTTTDLVVNREGGGIATGLLDRRPRPRSRVASFSGSGIGEEQIIAAVDVRATGWGPSRVGHIPPLTAPAMERPWAVELVDDTKSRAKNLCKLYAMTCVESHLWASALLKTVTATSNFELHQKVLVLWCLIVMGLFINSVWYQEPEEGEARSLVAELANNAYASATTLAVLIPSAFVLSQFFVYTPPLCYRGSKRREPTGPRGPVVAHFEEQEMEREDVSRDESSEKKESEQSRYVVGHQRFALPHVQLSAIALEEVVQRRFHSAATVLMVRNHPDECAHSDGVLEAASVQAALQLVRGILAGLVHDGKTEDESMQAGVIRNDEACEDLRQDPASVEFETVFRNEQNSARWRPALRQLFCCRANRQATDGSTMAPQFKLTACMFEMALFGDQPDLFQLLHRTDAAGLSPRQLAEMVCKHHNVGLAWTIFYAQRFLRMTPTETRELHDASSPVYPEELVLLYGLENAMDPVFAGAVTYSSQVEEEVKVSNEHVSWRDAVEAVVSGHLVDAAHLFRHAVVDCADVRRLRRAMERPSYETTWVENEELQPGNAIQPPPGTADSCRPSTGISSGGLPPGLERDALVDALQKTDTGLLFADGDPLQECENVRSIEYGRVMCRHYAILAGLGRRRFCERYLRQQQQLESENAPGALRPGKKVSVISDVDTLESLCEAEEGGKPIYTYANRVGEVVSVRRDTPESDPTSAILKFSEKNQRRFPTSALVYTRGDLKDEAKVGHRVVTIGQIKCEGEKDIPICSEGTIKKISMAGNWLIDFDSIPGKMRWVYRVDQGKLSLSSLQTSSLGRRYQDLDAGLYDKMSKQERARMGLSSLQVKSGVFVPRKANLHLTYALNVLSARDLQDAKQFPMEAIFSGVIFACSTIVRRGNFIAPLHCWTRRGPAEKGMSRGTGTRTNPFVGLESALLAARAGDLIVLLPGAYPPIDLEGIRGLTDMPLVIVSEDHHPGIVQVRPYDNPNRRPFRMPGVDLAGIELARLREIAEEDVLLRPNLDNFVPFPGTPRSGRGSARLGQARPEQAQPAPELDDREPTGPGALDAQNYRVKFTAVNVVSAMETTVLRMTNCRDIVILGVHFTNGRVAIDTRDSELIEVRDCVMDRIEFPHFQSAVDRHLGLGINNVVLERYTSTTYLLQLWWHVRDYPSWTAGIGYFLNFIYFFFCIILILLQTVQNFEDESKAIGWLTVTVIQLVIDAILVRPVIAFFKSIGKIIVRGKKLLGGHTSYVEMLRNEDSGSIGEKA
eukprot:Hpha_TRINITY_DN15753_c4_g6::TRINITY_DN15753_c4_g6_i1::g.39263::m.39263